MRRLCMRYSDVTNEPQVVLVGRKLNWVFVGLLVGNTMAGLDATIVATMSLRIQKDLGSVGSISSIFTAYQLAQIAAMPLYGKLGDLYGRKRVYAVAVATFLAGSAMCGAAPSLGWLVIARAIQGVGAGGLTGLTMAIVADIVPPDRLGRYLGYTGLIFAVTSVLGPVCGGIFADGPSWRWAFYINLPSGIACFVALRSVPRIVKRVDHRVDILGAALLATVATCVTLVATWGGRTFAWSSLRIVGLTTAALVALFTFIAWERRAPEPLLPARIFRRREVAISVFANLVAGVAFFGGIVYLPVFYQSVGLRSATIAGRLLIPFAFSTAIGTTFVGQVMQRTRRGTRTFPLIGMLSMLIGFVLLSLVAGTTSVYVAMGCGMFVGLGIGFTMQVMLFVVQRRTEVRDLGAATAVAVLARIAGSVVGVAVAANVLNQRLASELGARGNPIRGETLQGNADWIIKHSVSARTAIRDSYAAALGTTFRIFVPIMCVGFVVLLFLPRNLDALVHGENSDEIGVVGADF